MKFEAIQNIELADIFKHHWEKHNLRNKVNGHIHKVIGAIINCRTSKMGAHIEKCSNPECNHEVIAYNSCKDRHCPKCSISKKLKWIAERIYELLPTHYFHTTCTAPPMAHNLFLINQRICYDIFFKATSFAINALSRDPRLLGAQLGFVGILHTWGQTLVYHPHIHYIITGGGLKNGKWIRLPWQHKFLFPAKAMSKIIRQQFVKLLIKAYDDGKLVFKGKIEYLKDRNNFDRFCKELGNQTWYSYTKPPFANALKVVEYMGRYTHRVAISNQRLISLKDGKVKFWYKDYKDDRKRKVMTLPVDTFIQRFLYHILPKGFRKIRHFGFLNTGFRANKIQLIREQISDKINSIVKQIENWFKEMDRYLNPRCPECKVGHLKFYLNSS